MYNFVTIILNRFPLTLRHCCLKTVYVLIALNKHDSTAVGKYQSNVTASFLCAHPIMVGQTLFSWNFDTYVSIFYVMRLKLCKKYETLRVRIVCVRRII